MAPTTLRLHATIYRLSEVESGQSWYSIVSQRMTVLIRYPLDRIEPVSFIVWITQLDPTDTGGSVFAYAGANESFLFPGSRPWSTCR